jgi:hypothetical protein
MVNLRSAFMMFLRMLSLSVVPITLSVVAVAGVIPAGSLNGIDDSMNAAGSVAVLEGPFRPVSLEIFVDGPVGGGAFAGRISANTLDLESDTEGSAARYRFKFLIPSTFRDAKPHLLYAYVVQANGSRVLMEGVPRTFTSACSITICTSLRIGANGQLKVRAMGKLEQVYDHDASGCEDYLPDVPPRAFRDAVGTVHFISSQLTTYEMSGPTLDSLQPPDCKPVMRSVRNPNASLETYYEWLSATYTPNGEDVYALVHDEWYPSIIDRRCDPDFDWKFRINAITLAVSHDRGQTFYHPADYKLFQAGTPWKQTYSCRPKLDDYVYGPAEPSNIVRSGGFYYFVFHQGTDPGLHNDWGVCLARTPDISRAGSWSLWTRRGWVDGLTHVCDPISKLNIGDMHTSITYNTYLRKFLLVGCKYYPFDGVYLATSADLIHWDPAVKIVSMHNAKIEQGELRFPVLLDPNDTSRNFENSGQTPYLYFALQHDGVNTIDVVRQQILLDFGASR